MNAVEIEEAISQLAEAPFDPEAFPFAFLEAFGNKATTIKRLKSSRNSTNQSDLGGILQRNNIHLKVCPEGEVSATLAALRESPATSRYKAKFILATDGKNLEAENLADGETVACDYPDFSDHFGFFLPLAGITTVKQIRENAFDIKATGRLNRLYVELLKHNPDWDKAERQEDFNHFMARLIFCFFAEDTNIFNGEGLFTAAVQQMSAADSSNTHEVISELFRAMAISLQEREAAGIRNWANVFPYVNGGLFSGSVEVPRFSKIARSYLLHVGNLDWKKINPDIFGSMIQAVADEKERGALGMHYTSVPNILKVLNPLFLDDLRNQLEAAGDNKRKLLNLRQRMARIRVFDPACGSGNFLVIAYKEMRRIEAEINRRRGEAERRSDIPLTNFRGIEIRHFSAEVARLALTIAEYQCNVIYLGQQEARSMFLPLTNDNWITCGNALRLDWLSICPPTGTGVKVRREDLDLWGETQDEAEIEFENEGGETYICGNPPYKGSNWRTKEQTEDLGILFASRTKTWKPLDYVCGWFLKASEYSRVTPTASAFVATNSICQGVQAPILWPLIYESRQRIYFAHTSFTWSNLASHKAGVSVVIVGLSNTPIKNHKIYETDKNGVLSIRSVDNINAYLLNAQNVFVESSKNPISFDAVITDGSGALDGGNLILDRGQRDKIIAANGGRFSKYICPYVGSGEFIKGTLRWCLWIEDENLSDAQESAEIANRIDRVRHYRENAGTRAKTAISRPHKFAWINKRKSHQIIVPTVFSERREYITAGYLNESYIINNAASIIQEPELYIFSIVSSLLHISWAKAVSGKLRQDVRYTSSTCYNTFPVPTLTEQNKIDLTRCAEDILLAREHYFPATIADMYDPKRMDSEFPLVREAHDRNDEILERIYIGRRFKNDTERLEKLFELYTQMTAQTPPKKSTQRKPKGGK